MRAPAGAIAQNRVLQRPASKLLQCARQAVLPSGQRITPAATTHPEHGHPTPTQSNTAFQTVLASSRLDHDVAEPQHANLDETPDKPHQAPSVAQ